MLRFIGGCVLVFSFGDFRTTLDTDKCSFFVFISFYRLGQCRVTSDFALVLGGPSVWGIYVPLIKGPAPNLCEVQGC